MGSKGYAAMCVACAAFAVGLMACALAGCAPSAGPDADVAGQKGTASEQAAGGEAAQAAGGEADAWSPETDCAPCHASAGEQGCLAAEHLDAYGLTCGSCHADTEKLAQVHEGVTEQSTPPKRLKKTAVDAAACATCHDAGALKDATADSVVLTDSEGTTVNPHDLPPTDTHAQTTCVSCHTMHSTKANVEKDAPKVCESCHHEGVYQCGTCH